jgi:hypothetical protein
VAERDASVRDVAKKRTSSPPPSCTLPVGSTAALWEAGSRPWIWVPTRLLTIGVTETTLMYTMH